MVRTRNAEFRACLTCYAESFQGILDFGRMHATMLLELFELTAVDPETARARLTEVMDDWMPAILSLFHYHLVSDEAAFRKELEEDLWDKLVRTVKNHAKTPFYYLYFRDVYNDWQLDRKPLTQGQRAANFFFIRENCYGSMFRYNRKGEFNIPYGGMSYNKKDFAAKVETIFQPETASLFANTQIYSRDFEEFLDVVKPTKGDFLFLDPPYDTEFSDYEGNAFTKMDQARLAVALSKTPAKFLLIIKNTPFIEALYSQGFYIRRFEKRYSYNVRSRNDRQAEHLIITNYKIMDE